MDPKSIILLVQTNYINITNTECSLYCLNKIFLFLSLCSILIFRKGNVSKNSRQFLVLISFSSAISLILFIYFHSLLASLSGDVELNPGPNHK